MLKPNMLKQLDSRDEFVMLLLAGFIPMLTLAAIAHQSLGI